jgi:beta-lactamase regulating signal transducer with metallopeptidase domain
MSWLLANAACAVVLAVPAWAVGRGGRRPALAHALWLLVLLKLVTPPVFRPEVAWLVGEPEKAQTPPAGSPALLSPAEGEAAASAGPPVPLTFERPGAAVDGWLCLVGAWWLGSAFVLGRSLWLMRRFGRLLRLAELAPEELQEEARAVAGRLGLRRPPAVWLVPGAVPPMVWAVGRVYLLFPAALVGRLDPEARRGLLAHELAHVRRRDHWVRWLELAALTVFWWHPLAWWARRELHHHEELCCDALAATAASPRSYASAMLDVVDFLADGPGGVPALASGLSTARALRIRITRVLTGTARGKLGGAARAGLVVLACLILPLLPVVVHAEPEPPEADAVASLAFTPDGNTLVASLAATARPLGIDLLDGRVRQLRPAEAGALRPGSRRRALSPDGRWLAVGLPGDGVQVREAQSGRTRATFLMDLPVHVVRFSGDGRWLAAGAARQAFVFEVASHTLVARLKGHQGPVVDVAFAPRMDLIATASGPNVRLWDARTFKIRRVVQIHTPRPLVVRTPHSGAPERRTLGLFAEAGFVIDHPKVAVRAGSQNPSEKR